MLADTWFEVDKQGLAKLLEQRGKAFALFELIQNSWDAGARSVDVTLEPVPGKPIAMLVVRDDAPGGYDNLDHAFTLYAESAKKGNPELRGWMNLGEKLVLAMCIEATIVSTRGGVAFEPDGTRRSLRRTTEVGSEFRGLLRMTRDEYNDVCGSVNKLLPPSDVTTTFNGELIRARKPLTTIADVKLWTRIADENGIMQRRERATTVCVYEPLPGETATLYEMGIPVVETGDRYHVNVGQKVLLNSDRDNVTPGYLKQIRTVVLAHTFEHLKPDDASSTWVREAASSPDIPERAFNQVLKLRFGEKSAVADQNDPEANMKLVAQGYQLIHGAHLTGDEWQNLKRFDSARPAGQIAPTRMAEFGPDGKDSWIPEDKLTPGMVLARMYVQDVAVDLLKKSIDVQFLSDITLSWGACYGDHRLVFNVGRLGKAFFDDVYSVRFNSLLIHELSHDVEKNHLSEAYHEACCDLGAKLWRRTHEAYMHLRKSVADEAAEASKVYKP